MGTESEDDKSRNHRALGLKLMTEEWVRTAEQKRVRLESPSLTQGPNLTHHAGQCGLCEQPDNLIRSKQSMTSVTLSKKKNQRLMFMRLMRRTRTRI